MGKKQHSKDRMFITKTEWATEWGGAKAKDLSVPFKRLPFYCCSLTFTPFEEAVCTAEGSVFDLMNIVPYIKKYGRHPVTGVPLGLGDLIPITFHKNAEGEFHCPVLNKVFTEFTHIVAVKNTGNVFCYEAIKELNIKPKNWKELLTDEPFKKEDLITIQNPNELDKKVLLDFDHVKKSLKIDDEERKKMSEDPTYNINVTGDIKQMLRELGTEQGKQTALLGGGGNKAQKERAAALAAILSARSRIKEDGKSSANGEHKVTQSFSIVDAASASVHGRSAEAAKAAPSDKTVARIAMHMAGERTPVNAKLVKSRFTSGAASRSFTSTAYDPVTKNDFEYVKVEKNPKKKGYVQLHTTHGDLNIELHCDLTPRTCENFITLCERGYYNGVAFHRSIRNFMIQGGDPTGTGKRGESIWGKPFKDEVNSKLLHSGRGVVSMANSGPHTNGSQFFILYKSANHLNFKHTVFGGVVGGLTTLAAMEKVPIDDDDRPLEEIKITKVTVFVNPYTEPDEEDKEEDEKKVANEEDDKIGSWYSNPGTGTTEPMAVGGVGKYLKARTIQAEAATDNNLVVDGNAKKRKVEELAFLIKDNLYSKHLVLSTEQILIDFLQNDSSPDAVLDLEPMSSYHRLLVHRLADIFGFSHESVGEGDDRHIVLERCPESSIPSVLVSDILCQYDEYQPPTTTQHILRRKDVFPDLKTTRTAQPSAPLEERELAYEAARERIFSLHETDAKEPVTTKPRNVPVVARRMIAHALGQRISSNLHFHEASPLKSNEYGSTEELNQKIEVDRTLNNVGKQSSGLSTQNLALDENRGKVIGQSTSTSQVDKKMHNKMLTSPSNKEVCSRSNGRVVGIDNIEKQHHGAAKRMFAHALGLPPSKGDHGGGVLKCNEASKVSNSFGR